MSNKCPRCKKSVYQAEEALGAGMHWHKGCFNCATCHKGLDSTTLTEKDGEIYCKSCYGKHFGPKGYGYGGGAGVLSTDSTVIVTAAAPAAAVGGVCSECNATNQTGKFCSECGKTVVAAGGGGGAVTSHVTAPAGGSAAAAAPKPAAGASSGAAGGKFGGGDKCPRCGKTVYHAEKQLGAGSSWHKACFKCMDCSKMLDSDTMADKGGEIYCRSCYGKKFGPKGYGYGGGAGALKNTS